MSETKNVYQRLLEVQKTARAPRQIGGRFGNARSAEQILEAYKPVCNDNGLYLFTSDEIQLIGDRHYVTATATVVNADNQEEFVAASASAWENEVSGGLDTSQVTGKTSSYAKKYALQNLFAIDDTKDADQDEEPKRAPQKPAAKRATTAEQVVDTMTADDSHSGGGPTEEQKKQIVALGKQLGYRPAVLDARLKLIKTAQQATDFINRLELASKQAEGGDSNA